MSRQIQIEHNGVAYSGEIMTIGATMLGYQDHGIFTLDLTLRNGPLARRVGGYVLGDKTGMAWVREFMSVVGVRKWEDMEGNLVIALNDEHDQCVGLAHISDTKVEPFIFEEFAQLQRETS
jgi:hypothetical protein